MARKKASGAPPQKEDGSAETPDKRPTRSKKKTTTPSGKTTGKQAGKPHLKAGAMGTRSDATNAVTVAPRRGRSAGQRSHNMDEDNVEEPGPEAEQSKKDTRRKQRQYPPVTVTEHGDSEGDTEDEGDKRDNGDEEVEDIEDAAVVIPHQSGKRKRTPDSTGSMDESATEADNFVTGTVLPRIQSQSHRVNDRQHRMTPSADSLSVPRLSPEFLDPPSPHSFASDSGRDIKLQKPMSSRKAKALQMAKAEEPKFIDSDSDDGAPAGKRQRTTAGDGKKPTVAKEDPVFDAIYKNAVLELKRQIYFVNAFPASAKLDNLPRKAYNYGVHLVTKSESFSRDELQETSKAFDGKWLSCLSHQISSLRTQLKTTTLNKVDVHFSRMANDSRKRLVATNQYWYEVSPTGEVNIGRPFLNGAIIDILKERYFKGRKSLYQLFPREFPQSLATEDGGKGPEIPPRLVALVATFIYYALTGNGNSSGSWKYETFNQIYEGHLAELEKIQEDNYQCYHLILNRLYSECMGDNTPVLARSAVSKNDYRGLDPENL